VGLVQIAVLGQTIFGNRMQGLRSPSPFIDSLASCSSPLQTAALAAMDADAMLEDDAFAKTSIGWVRILSRCFHVAALQPDSKLADLIAAYPAAYPGFLEACCSLKKCDAASSAAFGALPVVHLKGPGGHSGSSDVHPAGWNSDYLSQPGATQ